MKNPFEFGRELGPDELVDRDQEVAAAVSAILGAGKLFLIGPRRYGKTSVLRAASQRAIADGAVVLQYDAEAFPSLEQLAARLADTAAQLSPTIERAGQLIRQLFASVRPQASFDASAASWSVTLAPAKPAEQVPLLADVLDGVERAAARAKRPVAILLDEFQRVVEEHGDDAERQMRASMQRHRHVGYVFAGSKTRLLAEMTGNPNRPFYKLGHVLFLGPVPRAAFAAFLERGFRSGHVPLGPGAADSILDAAGEVPYNVQLLAHACWESCRAEAGVTSLSPRRLTTAFVADMHAALALRGDPLYTQLWSSLAVAQQKACVAIIQEHGLRLASTGVATRYRVPVPTMQKALKALEAKGIIREEQERGTARLRFEDPLFSAWIALVVRS